MMTQSTKAIYRAPRLVEFGSVRNLTGGSRSNGDDGICGMTLNGAITQMCMQ
jgi:hypothetical protein